MIFKHCHMVMYKNTYVYKKKLTLSPYIATKTSLMGAHNKRSDQGARWSSKSFASKKEGGKRREGRRSLWQRQQRLRLSRLYCTRNSINSVLFIPKNKVFSLQTFLQLLVSKIKLLVNF